jgi:hypothetical protein
VRFENWEHAASIVQQDVPLHVTDEDVAQIAEHQEVLRHFLPPEDPEARAAEPGERRLREALDAFVGLARVTAKVLAAAAARVKRPEKTKERVEGAREVLERVEPVLRGYLTVFTRSEDILLGHAALDGGLHWTSPNLEDWLSPAARMFIEGALWSRDLLAHDFRQLSQLRDWLHRRAAAGRMQTDCLLRRDIEAIRIDHGASRDMEALSPLHRRLSDLLRRYIVACYCSALLPPCRPCEDPAVLLACLDVEDCEVVEICNLERTFAPSWPGLQYWLPAFSRLGSILERICCPGEEQKAEHAGATTPGASSLRWTRASELMRRSGDVAYAYRYRSRIEGVLRFAVPDPMHASTIVGLAQLIEGSLVPPRGELPFGVEPAEREEGERLAESLRAAAPRRTLDALITERLESIGRQSGFQAVLDRVNNRFTAMDSTISEVERELKRRPSRTEVAEAQLVKRLAAGATEIRRANRRLEKANEQLAARVEALLERVQQLETR